LKHLKPNPKFKLFSIIAHDLRGPFINNIGLSDLLMGNGIKETNNPDSEKLY